MYVKEIIVILLILIIALGYLFRRKLPDNRSTVDELRDNNQQSEDINRQTGDIIDKLESENIEITGLNRDIGEDNRTAKDIIKSIREKRIH